MTSSRNLAKDRQSAQRCPTSVALGMLLAQVLSIAGCHHVDCPPPPTLQDLIHQAIAENANAPHTIDVVHPEYESGDLIIGGAVEQVPQDASRGLEPTEIELVDPRSLDADSQGDLAAPTNPFRVRQAQAIEMLSPEEIAAPHPEATRASGPAATPIASAGNGLINEEFFETDIREALLLIGEAADVDIIMDETIRGVVNTTLSDVTFVTALEKLLMPLGYVYAMRGNQCIIAPLDPKSPLFPHIAEQYEYRPLHLEAKALLDSIPQSMQPFVRIIGGANTLVIDAPPQYGEMLLERLTKIDQPVPQVVLEAVICVVSPESGKQFGIDWGHAVELDGKDALSLGMNGLAMSGRITPTGLENIFDDFATTSAFIRLLAENGHLSIRASPRVMAKDGEQANISIARESFFTVQPVNNASGQNGAFFFQQDIQKVESGISLDITPRIRGDLVTINIDKAEVSEDVRNINTELATNPFPVINRRSVSTTVHVKDGKTIVIGGLVQRETVDRTNRVPGFSKIPGMGYLFKNTQQQTREAEVVIFISPRIVRPFECEVCEQPPTAYTINRR